MITGLRNNMITLPYRVRDDVGPHQHDWREIGRDGQGEIYRQCRICDARSCVTRPRFQALRQDWLEYREPWVPDAEAAPAPVTIEPPPPIAAAVVAPEPPPVKRGPGRPRKIRPGESR